MTAETTTDPESPSDSQMTLDRWLRLGVLLVAGVAILAAGLKIVDYAFIPPDDALRHAATAASDNPYHEVVLFDEAVPAEDSTPGWHAVLRAVHEWAGVDRFGLVSFGVLFFFAVFAVTPLFLLRRPEAWAAVLLLAVVINPGYPLRLALGRPFMLSSTAIVVFVLVWQRLVDDPRSRSALALCVGAAVVGTWLHSTWFLLFAAPLAGLVTGRWKAALALIGAVAVGVLIGAGLTLQPWTHLTYNIVHVWKTMGTTDAVFRVSELRPFTGDGPFTAFALVLLVAWASLPELKSFSLRHVGVVTALGGWVLAFSASRFWTDLGLPALLAVAALLLQRVLEARMPARAPSRAVFVGAVAVALHLAISANHGRRWESSPLPRIAWLMENPDEAEPWLPGEGGIIYSAEMRVFYSMYLIYPDRSWRYILGPEQGIMPREDLATLHDIKDRGSWDAYQPWVDKLRPQDRLIVDAAGLDLPDYPGTEVLPLPLGFAIVRPSVQPSEMPDSMATPAAVVQPVGGGGISR